MDILCNIFYTYIIYTHMYIYIYIHMIHWVRCPVYLACSARWGGKTWKLFVKYKKLFV